MSIPKEPRQLMINIMYLVLTALLALNVSKEVIDAFAKAERSMATSNVNIKTRVGDTYSAFKSKIEKNKGRGQEHYDAAESASAFADAQFQKIEDMKTEFIAYSGGYLKKELEDGSEIMTDKLKAPDKQGASTGFFVKGYKAKDAEGNTIDEPLDARGAELRAIIEETRSGLLKFFDNNKEDQVALEGLMPLVVDTAGVAELGETEFDAWSTKNFYQLPMIASLSELTRYQNEIRTAESMVVEKFADRVGEKRINFDKFAAAVIPNGTKFFPGEKLVLQGFLTASSNASKPTVTFNGSPRSLNAEGRAIFEETTGSLGKKTIKVNVSSKNQFGETKNYSETFEYEVVAPPDHAAVVSATKMNVFYIGVDNPLEASISGIPTSKISANMTGGTMTPNGAGTYNVRVTSPGEATVNVSGPRSDGKGTFSDAKKFRVKRIPDPYPAIGNSPSNKKGGAMKTGEFKAHQGIRAILENFDFEADFRVTSFEATYAPKRDDLQIGTNQGAKFNSTVASWQSKVKPGDAFFFDNIKAVGPDGTTREIGSLSYKIR